MGRPKAVTSTGSKRPSGTIQLKELRAQDQDPSHGRSVSMRKLIASTFASLDGIMQAPGGPEEDTTGGFTLGGWMFDYGDESMDLSSAGFDGKDRELVLGSRTYQIFEAYWPYQPGDHPIAKTFNAAKKHVASRTLTMLHWNNSTLLRGDVVSAIIALKAEPGLDLQMIGSGNLIQTLQAASLIDEYNVWTFPVVLGRGKRLFSEAARPAALRLVRSRVSASGVVMSTYVPGGDIRPGSFPSVEPSEKELARRKQMANEAW
jgi:dihydrofolate reductase